MKRFSVRAAKTLIAIWSISTGNVSLAATFNINSPAAINNATTINFEGYADLTVVNNLYQNQGISFSRDDGQAVFISNWSALGRLTSSPSNVLATITDFHLDSTWATQLNVASSSPLYAIGAYFGNDQNNPDYAFTRLSVYGALGQLLGSVQVDVNNNTSVDQFIGIGSDVPFTQARFENFSSSGLPTQGYSVVIDDLAFAAVPEPTIAAMILLGGVLRCIYLFHRRSQR